ncbi:MAG: hypothetical protein QJR03_15030 [Sphaerobacter sp.]|nr:hypothetical protein [Sphaerobacter sp.]
MVTPDLLTNIANSAGLAVTLESAAAALDGIDQGAILAEEQQALTWELWDKQSPINGVPAEQLLARDDVPPGGAIYLIREKATGNVLYFQPHLPGAAGIVAMDEATASTEAGSHVQAVAQTRADQRVLQEALRKLGLA